MYCTLRTGLLLECSEKESARIVQSIAINAINHIHNDQHERRIRMGMNQKFLYKTVTAPAGLLERLK